MTIEEAIEEYCLEQTVRGNSRATVADYRFKLGRFRFFLGEAVQTVDELTVQMCRRFYLHLLDAGARSITAQSYIRSLRAFLHWLYLEEYIPVDLCVKFRLPKAKSAFVDVLTDFEIASIFSLWPEPGSWLDARNRVILSLMLDCGLRMNELCTAERRNLHLEERYLIVDGKGNKQRAVAFGAKTAAYLSDYLARAPNAPDLKPLIIKWPPSGLPGAALEGVKHSTIQNLFKRIRKRTGITRLHPHLLRHSFATRYLENGGNIYSLQMLLGHTSLKMVQNYVHLCTARLRADFHNFSPLDRLEDKKAPP